jgi:chromosome segregation ATPase
MAENVETRVAVLEKQLSQMAGLFDRLDTTIEKLTDVSNSIKQLLAVHETKINQQEITLRDIYVELEKRREEAAAQHTKMQDKITKDIETIEKRICDQLDLITKKTNKIETWRVLVVGGALTLGFILDLYLASKAMLSHVLIK